MGRSRKFSMRCKMGVLLVHRFVVAAGFGAATTEESVYHSARVKQVPNGTQMSVEFVFGWWILRERLAVGPLLGYECATSFGQS